MKQLITTLGPYRENQLGMILPHEHVFVDLRTPDQQGYAQAEAEDVVALMAPQIEAIKVQGISALVECSTGGVGRRADLDRAVSEATGLPIVVPTGNYREPWIPDWVYLASDAQLEAWMLGELTDQIEDSGDYCRLDQAQRRRRRHYPARGAHPAGGGAGGHSRPMRSSAAIPSRGRVVMDQLDIIEQEGYRAEPLHFHPHPGGAGFRPASGGGGARRLDRI